MPRRADPSDVQGLNTVVAVEHDANSDPNPGGGFDFNPTVVPGLEAMKCRIMIPKPGPMAAQQQAPVVRFRMLTLYPLYPMLVSDVRLDRSYRFAWRNPNDGGRLWHLYLEGTVENLAGEDYYLAANVWGVPGD